MQNHLRQRPRRRFGRALVALAMFVPVLSVFPAFSRAASSSASATAVADGADVGFSGGAPLIGGNDATLAADLDLITSTGATWVRVDLDWPSIQPSGPSSYNWSNTDRVIAAARSRGLEVVALPTYTPAWARPAGSNDKYPPDNPDNFASFVTAAVQRYAPQGVHTWEIWNEPNISEFWAPQPDVARYTTLLKKAYAAVHAVDASATVISAGLSPAVDASNGSQVSPGTFVSRMYTYGVQGYFDALGLHPYSFPYAPMTAGSWNTFYIAPNLYATMQSNGDGAKKIWATEIGFPTGTASVAVSESVQADYLEQAVTQWTAWSFHGPIFVYTPRDHGTNTSNYLDNFGIVRYDRTPKAAYARLQGLIADSGGGTQPPQAEPPVVVPGSSTMVEGNSGTRTGRVTVNLSAPSSSTVTVAYRTVAVTASGFGTSSTDYTGVTGTLTFTPGQTSATVSVTVKGDRALEPNESVVVAFSDPVNARIGGFYGLGWFVINNDD